MALVSGGRSTLNPNAPLYIPAAVRKVEDFSPEWWELITTSPWFHDYWLSQNQEADLFYNNAESNLDSGDIADLLPDEIDLGIEQELFCMESQLQEFAPPFEHLDNKKESDDQASKGSTVLKN